MPAYIPTHVLHINGVAEVLRRQDVLLDNLGNKLIASRYQETLVYGRVCNPKRRFKRSAGLPPRPMSLRHARARHNYEFCEHRESPRHKEQCRECPMHR